MSDDLYEVERKEADPRKLGSVTKQIKEALTLAALIEDLEGQLAAAKKSYYEIVNKTLPEMMMDIDTETMSVSGYEVSLKQVVSGSLPSLDKHPERRKKAIAWLIDHDAGDLIKTDVEIQFTRSEHNQALSLAAELVEKGFDPKVVSGVHAQTLCAWVRERLANGEPVDIETIGVNVMNVATIKEDKKAKKAKAIRETVEKTKKVPAKAKSVAKKTVAKKASMKHG